MPSFAPALGGAVSECLLSLQILRHSQRFERDEFGWPGATAPRFVLVATESALPLVYEYWDAQQRRQAQQQRRLVASYELDRSRHRLSEARRLHALRLAQLEVHPHPHPDLEPHSHPHPIARSPDRPIAPSP